MLPVQSAKAFGKKCTPEEMAAPFRSTGSPEDWARNCGSKLDRTQEECLAVAKMLRLGAESWDFEELPESFGEVFPTAI